MCVRVCVCVWFLFSKSETTDFFYDSLKRLGIFFYNKRDLVCVCVCVFSVFKVLSNFENLFHDRRDLYLCVCVCVFFVFKVLSDFGKKYNRRDLVCVCVCV